ncbi:Tip attachment protein J [uncultured Caudovirales phage]|uniref:Tip attachment protein J n=1 Tax=uncultured Caudovirales phage TaxID=2100421 RepID=A0A6J7WUC2_9CAUD|nr:Tip attachment protein J [uncultured Caudovirales phage]
MAELLLPGSDEPVMQVDHAFADAEEGAERSTQVIVHPHPFYTYSQPIVVRAGMTLAEIVAAAGIPATYHGFLRVFVDDMEVPRAQWAFVRPRVGRHVYVRATPQGGGHGGKNILSMVLMLVVVVAASFFAPMIAGAMLPGMVGAAAGSATAFAFSAVTHIIGAGLTILGAMAINALIPPPSMQGEGLASQRALLSGVKNQFAPYADIPRHFGKRRVYPLMAAHPYTEAQGKKRYLRVLLAVGWGPLSISDIKIGETPIANFNQVEYEVREGWDAAHALFGTLPVGKSADTAQTLFTNSVSEDSFSILLDDAGVDASGNAIVGVGAWQTRTTLDGVSEISVDLNLPYGWVKYNDNGSTDPITAFVDVEYRLVGASNWTSVTWAGHDTDDGTDNDGELRIKDESRSPTSRGGRWKVPTVGQYEVRLRRRTKRFTPERKYAQRIEWSVLRSIKPQNPLNISGLSVIALRLKATDQLNGFPDAINCVVESYLPAYNGSTWSWSLSHSPGWAYADLMRRRGVDGLIADTRIDLTGIKAWADACAGTAPNASEAYWEFNGTFERGALFTALRQVAAHGRASFLIKDGRYSIVRDVSQTVPVQHITPRNSFGYSGEKGFVDLPHGLKITFVNLAKGYQQDEVIVYADGYSASNASKFESMELPGCTSATQAWREGRYYLAVGQLRPEVHSVTMDIEHLRCTMGDLVRLSHDVLSIGIASGRIASLDIGRNVLIYSEQFNNAAWTKGLATVSANTAVAPDGTTTADTLTEDSTNNYHTINQFAGTIGAVETFSFYAKAAGRSWVGVQVGNTFNAYFDLANGVLGTVNSGTASISAVGNGWYRCAVTTTRAGNQNNIIFLCPANGTVSYLSNGTSGVYLWGAQLEAGSTVTAYQKAATSVYGLISGLVLDNQVQRDAGINYVARIRQKDGTSALYSVDVKSGAAEVTSLIPLLTPVATSVGPMVGDLFIFGISNLESAPMLVKKIEPGPNMTAKVTLVDAQPGVWTADTGAIPAFDTYITNTTPVAQQQPAQPSFTLASDEGVIIRLADGTLQDRIAVTLGNLPSATVPATDYEVQFKKTEASDWQQAIVSKVAVRQAFIAPVLQGASYDVRLRTISQYGVTSDWVTTTGHVVVGKTTVPSNVTGFAVVNRVDGAQLSWTANPEIDVFAYAIRRGSSWDTAEIVSEFVTGTSFFVGISVATAQTFLIRAVDAIGLLSDTPSAVTAAVAAPDDITTFETYPQNDSIRFTWVSVPGTGIEYEIRAGDSWASGQKIARSGGNTVTVKLPAKLSGTKLFWIKAVSTAGLYSATARFKLVDQAPIVNRNIVLEDDFSLAGWAGAKSGLTINGSGPTSFLTVNKGIDGLSMARADFYRAVSLPAAFYARNWLEANFAATISSSLTWDGATSTWAGAGSIAWAGSIGDSAGCTLTPYISIADAAAIPANLIEEFVFNGSTTGSAGSVPASSANISYGSLHFGQGLDVYSGSEASYTFATPSTFTAIFDFRFNAYRGSYAPFMLGLIADPLTDARTMFEQAGDFLLFKLALSGGNILKVAHNVAADVFRCSGTGQADIDIPADIESGDLLTFALVQDAAERRLMCYNHRTGVTQSMLSAQAPMGAFASFLLAEAASIQAPGVTGNLQFFSAPLAVAAFSELAPIRTPSGYQPFRELVPGDYRYQNAVVWLNIEVADRSLDITVAEVVLSIDVPDLHQKASLALTTSAVAVIFPTPFNAVPTLQVTQNDGTVLAIARVTNLTALGFTVQLFDATSPTTPVAGTIAYSATGY